MLAVGDARVRLEGEVEVVAGTRTKVERHVGRTSAGALIAWRQDLVAAAGAEVVCVGRLERDDGGAWTLRAASASDRLELYAIDHRGAAEPIARVRLATYGVLAAVGMAAMLVALGLRMERRIDEAIRANPGAMSLADVPRYVELAAITPTGRAATVRWLDVAAEFPVGRVAVGRALTIARRRGVDLLPRLLRRLDRHDELLALAKRRGDDALALEALIRLARFGEAAELVQRAPAVDRALAVPVLVMAGRWGDAAAVVEREAGTRLPGEAQDALRCVAAWFRHKSGDNTAGEELRQATRHSAACRIIVHAVDPQGGGSSQRTDTYVRGGRWTELAAQLEGAPVQCALDDHGGWGSEYWKVAYVALHLAPLEVPLDPLDSSEISELWVGSRRRCGAAWALITGASDLAPANLEGDAVYTTARMSTSDGYSPVDGAASLRRGVYDEVALGYPDHLGRAAILDALDGDARQLVRYVRRRALRKAHEIALGLAPQLAYGRGELAAALMWIPDDAHEPMTASPVPDTAIWRAFRRRTILRMLGRDDLAAPDAAIVARVVEVLRDRDKVLALAFWSAR